MLKKKRYLVPFIALIGVFLTVMILTAAYPAIDYGISRALTSGGSVTYTIGNIIEIWAEPVSLLPMCFVIAACAVCFFRLKDKAVHKIVAFVFFAAGAVLSEQVIYRIARYYCKLTDITKPWTVQPGPFLSDNLWFKAVCTAAGVCMFALMVFFASKIKQAALKKLLRVFIFIIITLAVELILIEGLKNVFGRMRYREWINTGLDSFPWYRINGKPVSDAFKSFPSGHTANALLILPITFIFDALGKVKTGRALRICHLFWMIAVMTSRIMAGAHFLSDVCGGAMISLTIVTVTGGIIFKDGKWSKEEPEKRPVE